MFPPVRAKVPSGEKATLFTPSSTRRFRISLPVAASQSRITPSCAPDRHCLPSGEKATQETARPPCPTKQQTCLPEATSQTRLVPSQLAVAHRELSGEKATPKTASRCSERWTS